MLTEDKIYYNYHKHTHYSNIRTLDVVTKPEDYMKRAKELGHNAYFTTEHGFGGNIFESYTLCQKYSLKCIFGVEAYYVDDISIKERTNHHLILIALNRDGFKDINRIMSIANKEGFYYKPRIDLKLLLSLNPKNIIVTTACVAGRLFKTPNYEQEFVLPLLKHFKNNFFLEVQSHDEHIQRDWNKKVLILSQKYNIPIIHANDSHYILPEQSKYRDLFLKAKGINYEDESNFILDYPSYNEIIERYKEQGVLNEKQIIESLKNTMIFEKCEDLNFDKEFKIPKSCKGNSNKELKTIICNEWNKKSIYVPQNLHKEYLQEIKDEFKTIVECGMSDYFILNYKIVDRAVNKYNAVLTRSGRGSAVSFLINKILGLTEVDMMKAPVTLYPSRFMTSQRILNSRSLPDIDMNWADVEPVIKASKDILGEDGIYYMVSYKPLQESSAFRLWCKANNMNISEYNEVAKNLDDYIKDGYWGKIIEESKIFRGVIESIAPSPCSFLLLDKPISEEIGLIKVGDEICCSLDGYNCDQYKYLKNDFLTVAVYRLISETYKLIGRPIDRIEDMLNQVDESVWKLYEDGITSTLNQADSDFATGLLKTYKPKNLGELTAFVASIRPGFASLLNNFLERKPYSTGIKELDDLLEDSFHYMMYQESIMKFLIWLGIEEKETYDIIKHISKKKFTEEELEELKVKLEKGWIQKVGTIEGFTSNWKVVEDAVRYSFNASHALSVAIDSLYGAYLKRKYPLEYMTVALNEYLYDIDKTDKLCKELSYFNITIFQPKFRFSKAKYMCDKETNSIYKGIASIKYLNEKVANELFDLKERKFDTFTNLIRTIMVETSANFRQLRILTKINYFSEFGKNKKLLTLIDNYESKLKNKSLKEKTVDKRMLELIEVEAEIENKSLGIKEQIECETEYLGSPITTKSTLPENIYIVVGLDTKYTTKVSLYCLKNGQIETMKCLKKDFKIAPFGLFNVLRKTGIKQKAKRKKIEDKWVVLDEKETYLSSWDIIM